MGTARDVLQLVRGYHEAVVRPEMYGMVLQLEGALRHMNDQLFATRSELNFMAREEQDAAKACQWPYVGDDRMAQRPAAITPPLQDRLDDCPAAGGPNLPEKPWGLAKRG